MERRQPMDIAGFATIYGHKRLWMKATAILLILAFSSFPLRAQGPLSEEKPLDEIKRLLAEERWREVVQLAEIEVERSAGLNYYYGTPLSRLETRAAPRMAFP